jgi:hypothetical protein
VKSASADGTLGWSENKRPRPSGTDEQRRSSSTHRPRIISAANQQNSPPAKNARLTGKTIKRVCGRILQNSSHFAGFAGGSLFPLAAISKPLKLAHNSQYRAAQSTAGLYRDRDRCAMSLLHQDTPDEIDDAARGEEFTKGSSHVTIAAVVAAVVVTLALAFYFVAGQKPAAATGQLLAVWVHPQHTQTSGLDANGDPAPVETSDQILVFAKVRLTNRSQHPLSLASITANAKMPDGIHSCYAASLPDYDRIFILYPNLPVPHDKGLPLNMILDPGQNIEGTFVSAFKMTPPEWAAHTGLDFSISFRYQPSLVLVPQGAITEQ